MKNVLMFIYSIVAYLIAFASILFWILSLSGLIPEIAIDQSPQKTFAPALLNNLGLILLFGLQHSIMARQWFKDRLTKFLPQPMERSTFVLISGLLLFLMVYQWEPMGGTIWQVSAGSAFYYSIIVLSFTGWAILFISTFLINHFDLFGLRQTFLELQNKPYTQLEFRITGFYKYVRHPLYLGMLIGIWAAPTMTVTHLVFALGITAYIIVGTRLEEKDLVKAFDQDYKGYQNQKPMFIPFTKKRQTKNNSIMKNAMLIILSICAVNISHAQPEDHSSVDFGPASVSHFNTATEKPETVYFDNSNAINHSIVIRNLNKDIARYNLKTQGIYDNSEKASYQVTF